jgi:plastocyanin
MPPGPPASSGAIGLSLSATSQTLRMNESKPITVTVTPKDGLTGVVALELSGAPAGVTAAFEPPGVMLSGAPAQVQMTLKAASDAQPKTGYALSVKAVSGAISAVTPLTLDVAAELLVVVQKGVALGTSAQPNLLAFGASPTPTFYIAPGTKVTWVNQDSVNHRVHSDGTLGIAHEGGDLMANSANTYSDTFTGTGTFSYRCHIHPNMKGQIVIKAMPQ